MGRAHDKDVEREQADARPSTGESPGRVEIDERGRNVWRWSKGANDSTSVVLKRLDNQDLALEPTRKVPIVPASPSVAPRSAAPKGVAASSPAVAKGTTKTASPQRANKTALAPEPSKRSASPSAPPLGRDGGFDPYNRR